MTVAAVQIPAARLPAYAVFAALLASAGLPIYIHAPKFYVDAYGVSLGALGAVLFALRLLDVVQDPLLGRLSERLRRHRGVAVAVALAVMAVAMIGLFAVAPPIAPLWWFALMLTLVFSGFSFLTISFYAQGVQKASDLGDNGHLRLARWRETGALLGICAASIAPVVLGALTGSPFAAFAGLFTGLAALAWIAMRLEWSATRIQASEGLGVVLRDRIARRLLIIALINAAPVAVTSTLFLFFVESRLQAPGMEGALLLLFFLSAAGAAPIWSRLAENYGAKSVLALGMVLSILAFGFAVTLGAGQVAAFAVICVVSGAALGADMTLLPALFAKRMAEIAPTAAEGFGLWSFVSKFTLAFAAAALLPALQAAGFQPGAQNDVSALMLLTALYAALPCGLKALSVALLLSTDLEER